MSIAHIRQARSGGGGGRGRATDFFLDHNNETFYNFRIRGG